MTDLDAFEEDLAGLVERAATRFGEKVFLTFGDGSSLSFAEFGSRVRSFAALLRGRGIEPGQRVGLMMKNSLDYPVAWLGAIAAGAIAVPTNSRLGTTDAQFIFGHSGAVGVVVDSHTEPIARAAGGDLILIPVGDTEPGDAAIVEQHAGNVANIQYTSGTTGFPKGCLLTHRYWQQMGAVAVEVMRLTQDDTLLTSQPHSYIDPQWQVIAALRSGAGLVILDSFHPRTFMADVARFGVSVFYCLGVMPTLLLKQPSGPVDRDHSVTRVFCSAIPTEQHAEVEARWGVPWMEVFGMTETGINTAVSVEQAGRFVGSGSIGRALEHNEATVFDVDDRPLPPGHVGELVLRGTGFMRGYHDDPEATAEFFRGGWAHTGDLVEQDAEGFIYYRGRRKEMIRRGGENISPVEVESALGSHPAIVECAVAPVPDPDLGEEAKAYVVLRPGAATDTRSLHSFLSERLASFKVPRYWEFRASLPHTPSERVAKHELERDREDFRLDTTDMRAYGNRGD